jgi:hypothetical protein
VADGRDLRCLKRREETSFVPGGDGNVREVHCTCAQDVKVKPIENFELREFFEEPMQLDIRCPIEAILQTLILSFVVNSRNLS